MMQAAAHNTPAAQSEAPCLTLAGLCVWICANRREMAAFTQPLDRPHTVELKQNTDGAELEASWPITAGLCVEMYACLRAGPSR